jgi:hypothetical protein
MADTPVSEHNNLVCIVLVFEKFLLKQIDLVASARMAAYISSFPFLSKAQNL